jgi:adenosylcobinamide-phosphate synthase
MNHFTALLLGFFLDLLLGDPHWLPHPVQGMGWMIGRLEPVLRASFPKTPKGERAAGMVLVLLVSGSTILSTAAVLALCYLVSPVLAFCVEVLICYQLLATKSLRVESMKVYHALNTGTLEDGRKAVSMIVGRDTENLTESEVIAAAVETVAENTSDGILAPMLWMAVFGPLGGMFYKAVNTMDSMVGYQSPRFLYYGRAAAKLDDVLNFLPARIAGFLMCVAACLGFNASEAFHIFFRDRRNHKSPNSAHTEAACAGALGVQLGGAHNYFGQRVEKPTIGDDLRPLERKDISRANQLALLTAVLAMLLFGLLPLGILTLIF